MSHGRTMVFWTDGSAADNVGGAACVAEEHDEYIMHDYVLVRGNGKLTSNDAELAAVMLAQKMIEHLDEDAKARACVVTDSASALSTWYSHRHYMGGAPVFFCAKGTRPIAYRYAHYLANAARKRLSAMQPLAFALTPDGGPWKVNT